MSPRAAIGVDFEMYGKDLIPSAELSSKICKILGGTPPAGFAYELFLDENGEKISKSNFVIYNNETEFVITQTLKIFNQLKNA